jgi:hypothetical protein
MNKLIEKFDSVSSLGYNCYTKLYFNSKKMDQETQFFDYIGTSVWSIIDLLNNDFEGMFDKSNYTIMNVMKTGDDNQFLVVNEKYFIRSKHEFKKTLDRKFDPETLNEYKINSEELDDFIEKMKRRKERFMNMLANNNSLLFIRYEEDPAGRLDLKQFDEKFNLSYIDGLKILSDMFKKINPAKKITILNLSHRHDKTEHLKEYGIIKLRMRKRIDHWKKCVTEFEKVFSNEKNFIENLEI